MKEELLLFFSRFKVERGLVITSIIAYATYMVHFANTVSLFGTVIHFHDSPVMLSPLLGVI